MHNLLWFSLAVLTGCGASGRIQSGKMTVLSPNGGELWSIGATMTVSWEPGGTADDVDIDLSTDGGRTWSNLVAATANDGTEDIVVPSIPTHQARIRVGAVSAASDASDGDVQIGGPPSAIGARIEGLAIGATSWGDYDNDGDLDLAIAGSDASLNYLSRIYESDAGAFNDIGAGLEGVSFAALSWGDYDNDGDLDLAVAGETNDFTRITRIYRNDAGSFVDSGAGIQGVTRCSLAWGDYDNDGDLDLALTGRDDDFIFVSRVYRNDGGVFSDIGAGLEGVAFSSVSWGDYDNDGDLDLALAGRAGDSSRVSRIYQNDAGTFRDLGAGLEGVDRCSVRWGDYDSDGDLDLALAGRAKDSTRISRIYENDAGSFRDIGAGLAGVELCAICWGDYDNDGDLDLALAGETADATFTSRIYENDNGAFHDIHAGLEGVELASLSWADTDNDGDMDLSLAGFDNNFSFISRIYRNDGGFVPNSPPTAPTDVVALVGGGELLLGWLPSTDAETPPEGLSYNVRIGKTTSDDRAYPSMADGSGVRRIPARGPITNNPGFVSTWLDLPPGVYFASVQAIDSSTEGGPWSDPVPFTIP